MTKYTRKADLLQDIQSERRRLEKNLARLPEDQLLLPGVVGDWSVKDLLVHLVEWEQLFLDWYRCGIENRLPSVQPVGMGKTAIDLLNQQFYIRNQARPLQDVLAVFHASYQEIYRVVQQIPEEDMFSPGHFNWTGRWVLGDYIAANTCSHYAWANGKVKSFFSRLVQ